MSRGPGKPADGEGYWTKHYQSAYLEDAANPDYPLAIRAAFFAYGKHKANGHARFRQGDVAKVLGETIDGTFYPASKYAVSRAIATAVNYGLLAPGSKALCLIVPGHRIQGYHGDENAPCDRHRQPAKQRPESTLRVVS